MNLYYFKKTGPTNDYTIRMAITEDEARQDIRLEGPWGLRGQQNLLPGLSIVGTAEAVIGFGQRMRRTR